MTRVKIAIAYGSLVLANFIANFLIYNYSCNVQARPYLDEEQRVESGMMKNSIYGL